MRVVILAGGMGTRLQEETVSRPKPMVEIGGRPILWHIMKHFASSGHREFFVALGYKGEQVNSYFLGCYHFSGNLTIDFARGRIDRQHREAEDWTVHLIDTGIETLTGGRIKRLHPWLGDQAILVTYGDGVSNIDLARLLEFHRRHKCLATVTAVRPPARFGGLLMDGSRVASFNEKPQAGEGWINGGFMVFEPGVMDYLSGDMCSLEAEVLPRLASEGQLYAYCHDDFWQCMDTLREKNYLEKLWRDGVAPWRTWTDEPGEIDPASSAAFAADEKRVAYV
jgi:glucose-1-phosphate cytidylyltransferase